MTLPIRSAPCRCCPYRKDCPSGIWAASEYVKLPEYDKPTFEQPLGVFLCHDGDRISQVCRGWAEVHGKQTGEYDLLSIRFAAVGGVADLESSGIELHESGQAACDAGMKRIKNPSPEAVDLAERIARKHGLEER